MSTITNETAEPSLGAYFVRLFKVDADQFQLLSEKPQSDRGCEFLNRPYELERLDAVSDSRRSLAAPIGCEYPIERPTLGSAEYTFSSRIIWRCDTTKIVTTM